MENMNVIEIVIQAVLGLVAFVGISLVSYLAWNGKKYLQKVDEHDKELILLNEITRNMVTSAQVRQIIKDSNEPMVLQLTTLNKHLDDVMKELEYRRGYEQAKKELSNNGN